LRQAAAWMNTLTERVVWKTCSGRRSTPSTTLGNRRPLRLARIVRAIARGLPTGMAPALVGAYYLLGIVGGGEIGLIHGEPDRSGTLCAVSGASVSVHVPVVLWACGFAAN